MNDDIVPQLNQKQLDILMAENQVSNDVLIASEQLTAIWISSYLDEIDRVEHFFTTKLEELINHFILM